MTEREEVVLGQEKKENASHLHYWHFGQNTSLLGSAEHCCEHLEMIASLVFITACLEWPPPQAPVLWPVLCTSLWSVPASYLVENPRALTDATSQPQEPFPTAFAATT